MFLLFYLSFYFPFDYNDVVLSLERLEMFLIGPDFRKVLKNSPDVNSSDNHGEDNDVKSETGVDVQQLHAIQTSQVLLDHEML